MVVEYVQIYRTNNILCVIEKRDLYLLVWIFDLGIMALILSID